MRKGLYITIGAVLLLILCMSCTSRPSRTVVRTSTDTVTDLSGRWNDTDTRLVSETMIEDMLYSNWLIRFKSDYNRLPIIITGYIRNRSSQHIATGAFIKDIERALINSGQATIVANTRERIQIRREKEDQQDQASFETTKRLGEESGADFLLLGTILSQADTAGGTTAITYQVNLELINIETNQKAWIGSKKIKKIIERATYKP